MRALVGCVAAPVLLAALVSVAAAADRAVERRFTPVGGVAQFSYTAWFALPLLPRRYQNHCGYYHGFFRCSDHCGSDYQVYYCSRAATGCCHAGTGYCDSEGHVRCSPTLY